LSRIARESGELAAAQQRSSRAILDLDKATKKVDSLQGPENAAARAKALREQAQATAEVQAAEEGLARELQKSADAAQAAEKTQGKWNRAQQAAEVQKVTQAQGELAGATLRLKYAEEERATVLSRVSKDLSSSDVTKRK